MARRSCVSPLRRTPTNTLSNIVSLGSTDESVPGPLRDVQAVRHILRRVVVTRHGGRRGPREIIMQRASEPLVAGNTDIFQRLIETDDCPLVHLLVRPVAAVNPHNRGLITVLIGVRRWPTKCLRPVRSKALGVLRVESVAERMANHDVLQHPRVPRAGQPQQSIATTCGFVDRLHDSLDCNLFSGVDAMYIVTMIAPVIICLLR